MAQTQDKGVPQLAISTFIEKESVAYNQSHERILLTLSFYYIIREYVLICKKYFSLHQLKPLT